VHLQCRILLAFDVTYLHSKCEGLLDQAFTAG